MVTATIRTLKRTYLPIDDWEGLERALGANELEIDFLIGRIALAQGEGEDLVIADRMEPLTQELCLHGPRALLSDQDHSFKNWDYAGTVSLRHQGDTVLVSGDHLSSASFPKRKLIASLLHCAEQVMALMLRLHAVRAAYNLSAYPYLESLRAECADLYEARYGPGGTGAT